MKPYLLIAGTTYYPETGTGNWKDCYDSYEEASEAWIKLSAEKLYDWYEIVDLREWMFDNKSQDVEDF